MAASLDVKTDADYIALRRRMSRLRVQNNKPSEEEEDDEDLSDEMLRDLIKYWKKNNTDIARRFIQTRKERKAKNKVNKLAPGTSGRRKSVEFEDLDVTKTGLRLKKHEPLHTNKTITRISESPECVFSDENLSVRRPRKTTNQQKMSMIVHRANAKTDMSKAEEKMIKSKLDSVAKSSPPLQRAQSSCTFRPRSDSGSSKDFRRRVGSESESFRHRSGSGTGKNVKKSETNSRLSGKIPDPSQSTHEIKKQLSTRNQQPTPAITVSPC